MGSAISELYTTKEVGAGHTPDWPAGKGGFVVEGELYHICPLSVSKNDINFTSFPGKCSATVFSLLFWLRKNNYNVVKIDDGMEVSPMDMKYYQITIQQKQTLERQIKDGLAGISSSITDFELLFHDVRKYKDFVDYFRDRELALETKDNDLLEKTEQSLRSIFIDQVDVHTGEGVALKLIAPRWPTIISDFMRLSDNDTDPKKIKKEYRVSEAEGVVLATKNKLYNEWRKSFEKIVKERYSRVLSQVKARKFSIDEYKGMLKPYIERYLSINEVNRDTELRINTRDAGWLSPGAQATSLDWSTIWAFKSLSRAEPARVSYEAPGGDVDILKADFPESMMKVIRENIEELKKAGHGNLKLSPTSIEPLDKWVWALYKYIEDYYSKKYGYNIRFSIKELLDIRKDFIGGWGGETEPYYKCFDAVTERAIIRLPDGIELEDLTFAPIFFFLDTQNVMLLRFIEWNARNKALEYYIDEMLGDSIKSDKLSELEMEYEKLFGIFGKPKPVDNKASIVDGNYLRGRRDDAQDAVMRECSEMRSPIKFFRRNSNYETKFDDVITGPYFTDVGSTQVKTWDFLKAKFDVPGFGIAGLK